MDKVTQDVRNIDDKSKSSCIHSCTKLHFVSAEDTKNSQDESEDGSTSSSSHVTEQIPSPHDKVHEPRTCSRRRGPIVFEGRSTYFTTLYKEVHNLAAFANRKNFEIGHITPPISTVLNYEKLLKIELEHLKTQIEAVVGDEYVPAVLGEDLTETDSDSSEDGEIEINLMKQPLPLPSIQEVMKPIHNIGEACTGGECRTNYQEEVFHSSTPIEQLSRDTGDHPYSKSPEGCSPILGDASQSEELTSQEPVPRRLGVATTDASSETLEKSNFIKFVKPPPGSASHVVGDFYISDTANQREIQINVINPKMGPPLPTRFVQDPKVTGYFSFFFYQTFVVNSIYQSISTNIFYIL